MGCVQLSLFGHEPPALGERFARSVRTTLDADCWLDYAPGFVAGHASLLAAQQPLVRWRHETRQMYEREVEVPRLYAVTPDDGVLHPVLGEVGSLLAARYEASFERVGLALYRDGRDSVAWHRDRMPRDRPTLVAIVSLGAPRRFLVRPLGGGRSRAFDLGGGDLLVMGGLCQARFEHAVPKRSHAAPRLSCMFRHVY